MVASIIFDVALCLLAIYTIVKFSIRGFVRSLLDILKMALALALASLLRMPLANLLNSWFMDKTMIDIVRSSLTATVENNPARIYIDLKDLPGNLKMLLTKHSLDLERFNSDSEAFFGNGDASVIESLSTNAGGALATFFSSAIAFVFSFIVLYIILSIICRLIGKAKRFEKIKPLDRVFGVILGIAFAVVTMWKLSQSALFVVDVLGPHAPEYIDPAFAENSFVIRMLRNPYVVDDILRKIIS